MAAFCDVSEERLLQRIEQYEKYGRARAYADYTEMLNDPAVDIVEVLTPHYLHRQMVLDSMAAGKHVSVQKVPAVNLEMLFLKRFFKGQYLVIDEERGILGLEAG